MSTPAFRTGSASTQVQDKPVRTNGYAARCAKCGNTVPAGEGSLTKSGPNWIVEHLPFCPQESLVEIAPEETPAFVPAGRYTVTFADGTYRTIRVRVQDADASFMPGLPVLSFLSGANNDSDYTSFAHVKANGEVVIWKRFKGNESLAEAVRVLTRDPKASALAYAEQSGCCARCGRTLTVPASLNMGYGPECARRV
jgi:hypothetical protein